MRVMLTVAYDGTAYVGWQSQVNGVAIQDVLDQAISDLFGREIKTIGASRTDAGVHAEGNVAVFDIETRIAPSKIAYALNARLPEDIRVVSSVEVPDDFHPRFQKTVKTYQYKILNRTFYDPLTRHDTFHYYYPLDDRKMNEAAGFIVGRHDFSSFCAAGNSSKTTIRTIFHADVMRQGDLITFTIIGDGFLYNMVRILAGTLIEIGAGKRKPSDMPAILEAHNRSAAGPTAVAKGLVLMSIRYPDSFR